MASGFITGTCSVNSGSKTVTLDGGVDASQVSSGTAIFINNFPPVEAISGTVGQITLRENWPNANQTSEPFTTIYTIEGLRDAVQASRDVSNNMVAITSSHETLLTSTDPSVSIDINGVPTNFTPYQFLVDQFEASQALLDAAIIPLSKSRLDNPLLHILKKNKLTDTIAGSITWTRSTTATYRDRYGVVQTAAADTPREEAEGWLIEGASTNLALRSEEFDNALWIKARTSISADATNAPDGASTADKLVEDATASATHFTEQTATVSSGATVTLSLYAKAAERTWLHVREVNTIDGQFFDVSNGVLGTAEGAPSNAKIKALANGWFRCEITVTVPATSVNFQIRLASADNTSSYTGDGTSGAFIWGAQVEELPFASSYIPTVASTVTRAADIVSLPELNSFPRIDYSVYSKVTVLGKSSVNFDRIWEGAGAFMAQLIGTSVIFDSGDRGQATWTGVSAGVGFAVATVVNSTDTRLYIDGALEDTQAGSETTESGGTGTLYIGNRAAADRASFLHISDFRTYDFALNDQEVKFLSQG